MSLVMLSGVFARSRSSRTDKNSTISSRPSSRTAGTNLAFKDWPTVFPNATCATALIDRVIHHADVIAIKGKSYRLREAEEVAAGDDDAEPAPRKRR